MAKSKAQRTGEKRMAKPLQKNAKSNSTSRTKTKKRQKLLPGLNFPAPGKWSVKLVDPFGNDYYFALPNGAGQFFTGNQTDGPSFAVP